MHPLIPIGVGRKLQAPGTSLELQALAPYCTHSSQTFNLKLDCLQTNAGVQIVLPLAASTRPAHSARMSSISAVLNAKAPASLVAPVRPTARRPARSVVTAAGGSRQVRIASTG